MLQEAALAETWTTFPSREYPPQPYTPNEDLISWAESWGGAGQKGAFKALDYYTWLMNRWGYPIYPSEPVSHTIAALQRESAEYAFKHRVWLGIQERTRLPVAQRMLDELAWILDELHFYLEELDKTEIPTVYSMAKNPEHLDALLSTPPPKRGIDYKELKERIDIVDFTGRYTQLKKTGKTFRGRCPLHQEKTASFYVYPESKSFYCFGCQQGGDVINFAKLIGVDRLG